MIGKCELLIRKLIYGKFSKEVLESSKNEADANTIKHVLKRYADDEIDRFEAKKVLSNDDYQVFVELAEKFNIRFSDVLNLMS